MSLLFNKKVLFSAIIIFFLIRIIISIFFIDDFNTIEDFIIAKNLVEDNGYTLFVPAGPTAIKTPIYTLFLSIFILIFSTSAKLVIVIFQHFLLSLSACYIYKIAVKLNKEKYGFIASWLFIIHPSYIYYPNVIEVTNLFIFVSILYIYFYVKFYKAQSNKNLIIFSIISGIVILTQPISFPIIFISWFVLLRKQLKKVIIPVIVSLLVISPWIIRNYMEFNKIIPFKSAFWMNFYVGYLPYYHNNEKYDIISEKDKNKIDSLYDANTNDVKMEPYFKEIVTKTIAKKPVLYIEKTLYQMLSYWWVPPRYFDDNRIQFLLVRKVPVIILNLLTLIGLYFMWRTNPKLLIYITLILVYFTLIYGLTQNANIRFKLDIEWLQLIPTSYAILNLKRKSPQ